MHKDARIYVAGGESLIGGALLRRLAERGYRRLYGGAAAGPDLAVATSVNAFFADVRPEYVFHAAGKSAGIEANTRYPAELMFDNLMAGAHVIHAAHVQGVAKLLFLASSCSYPKHCTQPMREADLLTGPIEPTNEPYAIAKLSGVKLCQSYRQQYGDDFIVGIPADIFGVGDDFSPEHSHVMGALIRKVYEAKRRGEKSVVVWGTGSPRREFLFSDDLADACIVAMDAYSDREPINLGGGRELSVGELAAAICKVVGFSGQLQFDTSRPDGMPRKALDSSKLLALGWRPQTSLEDALARTYQDFLARYVLA